MKNKYNKVVVKKDGSSVLIEYVFFADYFLALEDRKIIRKMNESEFLSYAEKKGWEIRKMKR